MGGHSASPCLRTRRSCRWRIVALRGVTRADIDARNGSRKGRRSWRSPAYCCQLQRSPSAVSRGSPVEIPRSPRLALPPRHRSLPKQPVGLVRRLSFEWHFPSRSAADVASAVPDKVEENKPIRAARLTVQRALAIRSNCISRSSSGAKSFSGIILGPSEGALSGS